MMTKSVGLCAVVMTLMVATTPGFASSCGRSIDRVQAQVDAAIDRRAGAGPWAPESLDATLSHQPTPRSVARGESAIGNGAGLDAALDALDRARDADRSGDSKLCYKQLHQARRALGLRRR